jgi:hypothetical protein
MSEKDFKEKRAAFVKAIKEEDFYREPWARYSLKQHWNGAKDGFHDHQLQRRWHDFALGWDAAKGKKQP